MNPARRLLVLATNCMAVMVTKFVSDGGDNSNGSDGGTDSNGCNDGNDDDGVSNNDGCNDNNDSGSWEVDGGG